MPDIRPAIGLPPTETVEFFRGKGDLRVQAQWDETWQEEHARFFTVTKMMDLQLLGQVRASLDKVVSEGGTFATWKKGILPQMKAAGWHGRVEDERITGVDHAVFIDDRRLRTIYDTNLRMARAGGQWQRIQAVKANVPYLLYDAVNDTHTRPLHRLWGGLDNGRPIVLPVDHPAWSIYFPPCGWGCRCGVIQLSERDLVRRNLRVTSDEELRTIGWMSAAGEVGGGRAPWRRSNGQVVTVPAGIDPGFAYNPGKASLAGLARQVTETLETVAVTNPRAARAVLDDLIDTSVLDAFAKDPDGAFPIGILDPQWTERLAAPSPVVVLPSGVYRKQVRPDRHAELITDDYRRIPGILADPDVVIDQGDSRLVFFRMGDRWMKAVVRLDAGQPNLAVVSFHRTDEREIRREAGRGTLLFDRRQ